MTPYRLRDYVHYTRKALINVLGIAGVLVSQGLVPAPYDRWLSGGVAVLAAAIHYAVPNAARPGTVPAREPVGAVDALDDDDEDGYRPTGASDDDISGVEAIPLTTSAVPETAAIDAPVGPWLDSDAQHMLAAVLELALRAVPPRAADEPAALV